MTLTGLVQQTFPSPEWATFFEVGDKTGWNARRADAVALGIWPSRGCALIGFEFKEDRRDWQRELANPAKADVIVAHCDRWYVVAGKATIVKLEEVPETWGLYVANEDRTALKCVKPAPALPDRDLTTIKRSFAAAMLRKVSENTVPKSEMARIIDERVQQAVQAAIDRTVDGRAINRLRDDLAALQRQVDAFEAASGVKISSYGGGDIGAAVKAVGNADYCIDGLKHTRAHVMNAIKEIDKAMAAWPVKKPALLEAVTP